MREVDAQTLLGVSGLSTTWMDMALGSDLAPRRHGLESATNRSREYEWLDNDVPVGGVAGLVSCVHANIQLAAHFA